MIVFLAFVILVLLGIVLQWLFKRWQISAGAPCLVFCLYSLTLSPQKLILALSFGAPMIFFAGLLGSFLYETRLNPNRHVEDIQDDDNSST